jgi:hypothetical protein
MRKVEYLNERHDRDRLALAIRVIQQVVRDCRERRKPFPDRLIRPALNVAGVNNCFVVAAQLRLEPTANKVPGFSLSACFF